MSNSDGGKSDFGLPVEICSLCGIRQPLIRAHIYPRKLYLPFSECPNIVAPSGGSRKNWRDKF